MSENNDHDKCVETFAKLKDPLTLIGLFMIAALVPIVGQFSKALQDPSLCFF